MISDQIKTFEGYYRFSHWQKRSRKNSGFYSSGNINFWHCLLQSVKLNPGNENAIKILNNNGVNTDDLIKKVPIEYLILLEGEYQNVDNKDWKIKFEIAEGILFGNDRGYRYKVLPVGEGEFVNPDDGATLVFDTEDKNAITMLLFGRLKFKKIQWLRFIAKWK